MVVCIPSLKRMIVINCFILAVVGCTAIVQKETTAKLRRPYENPDLIEGDMIFHLAPASMLRGVAQRGNGVAWTNGIVPYEIDSGYGAAQQTFLINTMQKMERLIAINNVACVQFRPKTASDRYYIRIQDGFSCSSYVGQAVHGETPHTVTLSYPGCFVEAIVMHELLHTLGFHHEQSRPDRDNYIRVIYENISPMLRQNFEKYNDSFVDTLGTPYDYSSVMHYESNAFSENGRATIETLLPNVTIGQRENLSSIDIQEVRLLYNCPTSGATLPPFVNFTATSTLSTTTKAPSSFYSSVLTSNSSVYHRYDSTTWHYYEAIRINVSTTATYRLTSISNIDPIGYLYTPCFDPNDFTTNLIDINDDGPDSRQFSMSATLLSSMTYILVVSTFSTNAIGAFTVGAAGDYNVTFDRVDGVGAGLCRPLEPPSSTAPAPHSVDTILASNWTIRSRKYRRHGVLHGDYYFEAYRVTARVSGTYMFSSKSGVDTYGYLYNGSFSPNYTDANLLVSDDDSAGNGSFRFTVFLWSSQTYILVPTTYSTNTVGEYTVIVTGLNRVNIDSVDTSSVIGLFNITTARLGLTTSQGLASSYSSALTPTSPVYNQGQSSGGYFYEAIRISVSTTGLYSVRSDSTMDTVGYLYMACFDPNNIALNLLDQNDDTGGTSQFLISATLRPFTTYILVVSTHRPHVRGLFSIRAEGIGRITFDRYNVLETDPSVCQPTQPPSTTTRKYTSETNFSSHRPTQPSSTTTRSKSERVQMAALFLLGQVLSVCMTSYLLLS